MVVRFTVLQTLFRYPPSLGCRLADFWEACLSDDFKLMLMRDLEEIGGMLDMSEVLECLRYLSA